MDWHVTLTEIFLGHPIACAATRLDQGLHVLLTGGERTHIGAVTTCRPGEAPDTKQFPGHKEQFVSEPWARALAEKLGEPVCLVCGIHYNHASKADIAGILEITDSLLTQLLDLI